jgi:hypothetical protein
LSRQSAAFRGLAIFLVVLNHSISLSFAYVADHEFPVPDGWERVVLVSLQTLGLVAVPVFYFIAGGFQIFALQGKSIGSAYRTELKALPHIIVPYFIWSVLFYILLFFIQGELFGLAEYFKFILVGYPLNFVPLLVAYYLISPILLRLLSRLPYITILLIGLYQAVSLVILRPDLVGIEIPEWSIFFTIPALRWSIALWGIFFPLGMAFSMYSDRITPWLKRISIILATLIVLSYLLSVLHELDLIHFPFATLLFPLFVVMIIPVVRRDSIPLVRQLESLGRRSYGLYLSNLILINIGLALVASLFPILFSLSIFLVVLLIIFTITVLWLLMLGSEKLPTPIIRRYVFG